MTQPPPPTSVAGPPHRRGHAAGRAQRRHAHPTYSRSGAQIALRGDVESLRAFGASRGPDDDAVAAERGQRGGTAFPAVSPLARPALRRVYPADTARTAPLRLVRSVARANSLGAPCALLAQRGVADGAVAAQGMARRAQRSFAAAWPAKYRGCQSGATRAATPCVFTRNQGLTEGLHRNAQQASYMESLGALGAPYALRLRSHAAL